MNSKTEILNNVLVTLQLQLVSELNLRAGSVCFVNESFKSVFWTWTTFMILLWYFFVNLELDRFDTFVIFKRVARIFFKTTSFVFYVRKKVIPDWNNMRVSELWQNCHVWVNYPFRVCLFCPGGRMKCSQTKGCYFRCCIALVSFFPPK